MYQNGHLLTLSPDTEGLASVMWRPGPKPWTGYMNRAYVHTCIRAYVCVNVRVCGGPSSQVTGHRTQATGRLVLCISVPVSERVGR